jgi:hydroxymethylglutaryl-CoA lyase
MPGVECFAGMTGLDDLPARHARAGLHAAADRRDHQPARPRACRKLPQGAYLINVARGAQVAEPELLTLIRPAISPAPRWTCSATNRCRRRIRSGRAAHHHHAAHLGADVAREACARSPGKSVRSNKAKPSPTWSTATRDIEMNSLPKQVKIVEVGPRDGLQNEKEAVSAAVKIELVDRLSRAGFPTSKRRPSSRRNGCRRWPPAPRSWRRSRAAGRDLFRADAEHAGLRSGAGGQADEVVIFGSASEAFSQKNINCSIAESIARFEPVAKAAKDNGLRLRGSISCAFGCPYQGEVPLDAVADVVGRMRDLGCDEIDIADTIGVSTPRKTQAVMERAAASSRSTALSGHFHDTYGQALANIYASLEVGVAISTRRSRAWAAARTPRARPATSPPKTCCT